MQILKLHFFKFYPQTPLTHFSWPQFDRVSSQTKLWPPPLPSSATPELVSAPATSQQDQAANEAQASASVALDPSQPVTNIQIRLADGGRLVQKFNHTHRWLTDKLFLTWSWYVHKVSLNLSLQFCGSILSIFKTADLHVFSLKITHLPYDV